jgi:hypothetical protein
MILHSYATQNHSIKSPSFSLSLDGYMKRDTRTLTSASSSLLELVLKDTNTYAPGPYPFKYSGKNGGALGYQWVATNQGKTNVLCYKWLNLYQFKTQAWIDLENSTRKKWELRHHVGCHLQFKIVKT